MNISAAVVFYQFPVIFVYFPRTSFPLRPLKGAGCQADKRETTVQFELPNLRSMVSMWPFHVTNEKTCIVYLFRNVLSLFALLLSQETWCGTDTNTHINQGRSK